MPLLCARLEIEADEAFAVEIVAGTVAAVVVAGRRLDGQIDEAELFVHRHLAPYAGVAGVLGGAVEPRLVAGLALFRNRVEGPETLAGADVEAADVAFVVLVNLRRGALTERGADHDDVARDDGRALKADLARRDVGENFLIDVGLEVNRAIGPERRNQIARLRVEREQPVAGRDVENPFVAAVGPIGESAAGKLTRRCGAARAFIFLVRPLERAR